MTNSESPPPSPTRGPRGSKVKKASAASVGATVLLVLGYLIASWLGIPLDGLLPQGPDSRGPGPERPVATDRQDEVARPSAAANGSPRAENKAGASAASTFQVQNVTVRNLDGKVVFRGTVDLTATMQRIDAGRRLEQFRNDGSTFQNRERRLPDKQRGYYTEYVHPTPKLGGPGPQRVVTGQQGEAYYTFDHYKTFQRIR